MSHWRLFAIAAFFLMLFGSIAVTLADLQIVKYDELSEKARKQRTVQRVVPARRGEILASDGLPVAQNVPFNLVYAVPWMIEDPDRVAWQLAPLLEADEQDLKGMLETDSSYVALKHWVTDEVASQISGLGLKGVVITSEEKRYYPEKEMLAHVLGYVNMDGDGQYGLEQFYNSLLKGKEGYVKREQDTSGRAIPIGLNEEIAPIDGANLILTIDRSVQRIVEEKLKWGAERAAASEGDVIVMDPLTGAIIAMANYPAFDPNDYRKSLFDEEGNYLEEGFQVFNNDAVSMPYEPGSVFKIVTMASALDSGKVQKDASFNDPGELALTEHISIRNWDGQAHGLLTLSRCLEISNNVCLAQVAQTTGADTFYRYIQGFGFGSKTEIDLAVEATGNIQDFNRWNDIQVATSGFGQGLTATPIQMITAISAVANRGKLIRPYIVREILRGEEVIEQQPQVIKQIISKDVAEELTRMMVNVVERSEGRSGGVSGYHIAGKTGTAQVAKKDGTGYEDDVVSASFVGYAPADAPKFIIFVKLNLTRNTHPDLRWGSQTAAPIFREIAKELFKYYEIPPVGV